MSSLERKLTAGHPADRLAYIAGKESFMIALEERALAFSRDRRP